MFKYFWDRNNGSLIIEKLEKINMAEYNATHFFNWLENRSEVFSSIEEYFFGILGGIFVDENGNFIDKYYAKEDVDKYRAGFLVITDRIIPVLGLIVQEGGDVNKLVDFLMQKYESETNMQAKICLAYLLSHSKQHEHLKMFFLNLEKSNNAILRKSAIRYLYANYCDLRGQILKSHLNDPDVWISFITACTLSELNDQRGVPRLQQLWDDPNVDSIMGEHLLYAYALFGTEKTADWLRGRAARPESWAIAATLKSVADDILKKGKKNKK